MVGLNPTGNLNTTVYGNWMRTWVRAHTPSSQEFSFDPPESSGRPRPAVPSNRWQQRYYGNMLNRLGSKCFGRPGNSSEEKENITRTSASGNCSATSTAQSPPPQPRSRILRGDVTGGKISRLSKTRWNTLFATSSRAISPWTDCLVRVCWVHCIRPQLPRRWAQSMPRWTEHIVDILYHGIL